jgi:SulP family sulfate permease
MAAPAPATGFARWLPVVATFRSYDAARARRDGLAALTVALFAIPQGMAFALIAGMPPAAGIWSAAVASILGAAFGSSEFLIDGPTNALSVLLAANAAVFASRGDPVTAIVLATFLVGAIQLLAAALRLGSFTRFVSEPVLSGFTAGAGLYIAVNQLAPLLGIPSRALPRAVAGFDLPANAVFELVRSALALGQTNGIALATGAATFAGIRGLQWLERRVERRIPAPFVAIFGVSLAAWALGLGDPSAGAHKLSLMRDIEPLRRALPHLAHPRVDLRDIQVLLGPALAIAVLGAVEAIAIGKTLAARVGHRFDANRQLVGEGMCNLGAALVGGFASSGSFTRSAVNFEAGAATRISSVLSGVLVIAIMLLFAPAANYIPVAVLAGTLIHVGLKLVNVGRLRVTMKTTVADRTVLLTTFAATLLVEHLQLALVLGVAVAIFQALRRAEGFKLAVMEECPDGQLRWRPEIPERGPLVIAIALQGELFFAAAEILEQRLRAILDGGSRFVVLRLTHAYNLDATCAEVFAQIAREARARGGRLILTGVRPGLFGTLERAGVLRTIGSDAVFASEPELNASTRHALAYAHEISGTPRPGVRRGESGEGERSR